MLSILGPQKKIKKRENTKRIEILFEENKTYILVGRIYQNTQERNCQRLVDEDQNTQD